MSVIMSSLPPGDVQRVLATSRERSEEQLAVMRREAEKMFGDASDIIIGVNGSVARRETTSGSDVDLFVLYSNGSEAAARAKQQKYRDVLLQHGIVMPSSGGVFDEPLLKDQLYSRIGGEDDTNTFITRRMLFLLEGEWIANQAGFEKVRAELIRRYVSDDLDERKLCKYLLNDIIRYWRTICIDFEFKTADATKPRAIRLIKLRFSRMMLYFAGVAAVSQTEDMTVEEKRRTLMRLLAMPAIDRISEVFGKDQVPVALEMYAIFLDSLDTPAIREKISMPGHEGMRTPEYLELCEVARRFKDELITLLVEKFSIKGDVVRSLLL